jgi:hypothetical protein
LRVVFLRYRLGASASYRDDVVTHIVETNDLREIFLIEVTPNRVTGVGFDLVRRFTFSENGVAEGAGRIPTLRRFFDQENKLGAHR